MNNYETEDLINRSDFSEAFLEQFSDNPKSSKLKKIDTLTIRYWNTFKSHIHTSQTMRTILDQELDITEHIFKRTEQFDLYQTFILKTLDHITSSNIQNPDIYITIYFLSSFSVTFDKNTSPNKNLQIFKF